MTSVPMLLSRVVGHAKGGVLLHSRCQGYLTLYVVYNADAGNAGDAGDARDVMDIVLNVTRDDGGHDIRFTRPGRTAAESCDNCVLRNLWVDAMQRVDAETHAPNRYIVWGVCTPEPMP